MSPESFLKGKRVLVTGASGFLGSRLCGMLARAGCELTRWSRRRLEPAAGIKDRRGDVRSRELWQEALRQTDLVFHLAAQTSAEFADSNPEEDRSLNVLPVTLMLEMCSEMDTPPGIVFAGTVTQEEPFAGQYEKHKLEAENLLLDAARRGKVRAVSLRLPNLYGPGEAEGQPDRGVLNQMIHRAVEGKGLAVYGDPLRKRDYFYIEDAARAFLYAGAFLEKLSGRFFVTGSGEGTSFADAFTLAAEKVSENTGSRVPVVTRRDHPLPAIENRSFTADFSAFAEASGWKPKVTLEQGIAMTVENIFSPSRQEVP